MNLSSVQDVVSTLITTFGWGAGSISFKEQAWVAAQCKQVVCGGGVLQLFQKMFKAFDPITPC